MLGRKRPQQERRLSPKKRFHTALAYHTTFQDKTEGQEVMGKVGGATP